MAMATYTPVGFYLAMPLLEMGEYADMIGELNKKSV